MRNWKIRYLNIIPMLVIAFLLCKLIFTTNISFSGILSTIYSCIAYFVYGLLFAYFLNPLVGYFERLLQKSKDDDKKKRIKRGISIAMAHFLVVGFITVFIINIVPAIGDGVNDFSKDLPKYLGKFQAFVTDAIGRFAPDLADGFRGDIAKLLMTVYDLFEPQTDVSGVGTAVTTAVSVSAKAVVRIIFGIVISIYFLYGKEKMIRHIKRLIYALFSKEHAETILEYSAAINRIFYDFIISKVLQSLVIFVLGLIILIPLGVPLAPVISLLLAVTNMIPYIGPWIGSVPSVLIAFLFNPIKGVIVLLFIVGMQILDNLFIGPKIMSDRVGISPLLVIAGVAVGGTFGGVIGMFLGVPLVAVAKLVFYDRFVEKRLKAKNLEGLGETAE